MSAKAKQVSNKQGEATLSIARVSEQSGLSAHTLRYYDKEGLLPSLGRSGAGNRAFTETDLEWLAIVTCLKNTGMPVKNIKAFIDLCLKGNKTLGQRHQFFVEHKKKVQAQIDDLEKCMEKIDYKIRYYKAALKAGAEKVQIRKLCQKDD